MASIPPEIAIIAQKGLPVDLSRDEMVEKCLEAGVTDILWVDTDNYPLDKNGYIKLLNYNFDFISGVYIAKKKGPKYPAAWKRVEGQLVPLTPNNKGLHQVDAIGFGFCKTSTWMYRRLKRPWFLFESGRWWDGTKLTSQESEDFFFCKKVIETLGIYPLVDFDLKCAHICHAVLIPKDDGTVEFDVI